MIEAIREIESTRTLRREVSVFLLMDSAEIERLIERIFASPSAIATREELQEVT